MPGYLERDVGMIEYIGSHQGFSAILKLRYQDFLVNEIDTAGNILSITDTAYKEPVNCAQKVGPQVSNLYIEFQVNNLKKCLNYFIYQFSSKLASFNNFRKLKLLIHTVKQGNFELFKI